MIWAQERYGTAFIFAHDGHLIKAPIDVHIGNLHIGATGQTTEGQWLAKHYKDDYVLIYGTIDRYVDAQGEGLDKLAHPLPFGGLPLECRAVFFFVNTMPATKFAISVPAETMSQVDRAAKRLGMTRSRYIAVVLARVAKVERDRSISKRVDDVLASLDEQDLGSVEHLRTARRDEGTEW